MNIKKAFARLFKRRTQEELPPISDWELSFTNPEGWRRRVEARFARMQLQHATLIRSDTGDPRNDNLGAVVGYLGVLGLDQAGEAYFRNGRWEIAELPRPEAVR